MAPIHTDGLLNTCRATGYGLYKAVKVKPICGRYFSAEIHVNSELFDISSRAPSALNGLAVRSGNGISIHLRLA